MIHETVRYNKATHDPRSGTPAEIIAEHAPIEALDRIEADQRGSIPEIAKDSALINRIEQGIRDLPTAHEILQRDSRNLDVLDDESVHLVITSPPYWTLKEYVPHDDQLGGVEDYEDFLSELDAVWKHVHRVLVPGGRLVVVVGDVCLSRRKYGRHVVFPLHASIQEHCRKIGFDNLAPIIWHKIANAQLEADGSGGGFLGKPYEPNAVIKNDVEYILFQRKGDGYRNPTPAMRALSVISKREHREWFQQIWTINGASTNDHPAPYPVELAERLVRMFSFVGDVVLDPFTGSGTTNLAAAKWGRNSIGIEVEASYCEGAIERLKESQQASLALH
jgi:DNA modification methylase